jgi:magnesium-transporting ATPase (P-type)
MVDREEGLSNEDADKIRAETGPNELTEDEPTSLWELILDQFDDTLVKILLVSAVISTAIALYEKGLEGGLGAFIEPIVILVILILNAIVGVWQESVSVWLCS